MTKLNIKPAGKNQDKTIVTIEVPPGQTADTRLDVYLANRLQNVTRSKVQQGIRDGRVTVNDEPAKPSYLVQPDDLIECVLLRAPPTEAEPEDIPLDIVFEDETLIVVNKPAGMVVHPAYGNRTGTLVNALLHHTGSNLALRGSRGPQQEAGAVRPGLVHRLDKDTSGLMVVAKDDAALAHLAEQFSGRTIDRLYRAVVWGRLEDAGRVETNLARDPRNRKRMAVVEPPSGKPAITNYQPVEVLSGTTLVQFKLETGRTHQIRVHAAHLGHPIFGDATYRGRKVRIAGLSTARKRFFNELLDAMPRQALHAKTLGFTHPATGERLEFDSEWPDDMQRLVDALQEK